MKAVLIILALFLAVPITMAAPVLEYDAIVVRSDLPYDWTVAQAYSQREKIPIITTNPDSLDELTRSQLQGFRSQDHQSLLVFGGEAAISPDVEGELSSMGFITHRIREVDRYGTSARVAVELYETSEKVILVTGEDMNDLLNSQIAALQTDSPILFIKKDEIPQSVREALRVLGTKEVILISPEEVSKKVLEDLQESYIIKDHVQVSQADDGTDLFRISDILVGLILGVVLAFILKREKGPQKVPYNILTDDEEKVVNAIMGNGGELGQDELYDKTGFSRPKISRVVAELVERDLVEKTPFKRTFKLKIKKELIKD